MRIAICTAAVPWEDRPTLGRYNIAQARALAAQGHDVAVLSFAPHLPPGATLVSAAARRQSRRPGEYEVEGVPVFTARGAFAYPHAIRMRLAPKTPRLIANWMRYAMGSVPRLLDDFAPDALVVHGAMPWGSLMRQVANERGLPFVIVEHSYEDVHRIRAGSSYAAWYRDIAEDAAGIFVVGSQMLEHLRHRIGVPSAKILLNGVPQPDPAILKVPRPSNWEGNPVLLCVGQYIERKGHVDLLKALARVKTKNVRLHLVGTPPRRISRCIRELGLGDLVHILPVMTQTDLLQHMAWSDLFVLPSWYEAFGLVYAEAMACHTPPIMTSDCGVAHEIEHGTHGWVVPPRSPDELAAAIDHALNDFDLPAIGGLGAQLVKERFCWDANARQIVRTFAALPNPDRKPSQAPVLA